MPPPIAESRRGVRLDESHCDQCISSFLAPRGNCPALSGARAAELHKCCGDRCRTHSEPMRAEGERAARGLLYPGLPDERDCTRTRLLRGCGRHPVVQGQANGDAAASRSRTRSTVRDTEAVTLVAILVRFLHSAGVAELADARDSKSRGLHWSCGFDPHLQHQRFQKPRERMNVI